MSLSYLTNIDLNKNELQNARIQNLGGAPGSPVKGQLYFDSGTNKLYCWNGTSWVAADSSAAVTSVGATAPIASTGGLTPTISINAATQSDPGSMSAVDKLKLDSATSAATASTLVFRDGSGNFRAASPLDTTDVATKGYVDGLVAGGVNYRGTADASQANPDAATGTITHLNGDMYRTTVSGSTAFGFQLNIGDYVIYNGSTWAKIDSTDPSISAGTLITVSPTGDTSYQVGFDTTNSKSTLGYMTRYATLIGDASHTSFTVTHNLNTRDVSVTVYDATTYAVVYCDIVMTDANNVTATFALAPALNAYRIVIIG